MILLSKIRVSTVRRVRGTSVPKLMHSRKPVISSAMVAKRRRVGFNCDVGHSELAAIEDVVGDPDVQLPLHAADEDLNEHTIILASNAAALAGTNATRQAELEDQGHARDLAGYTAEHLPHALSEVNLQVPGGFEATLEPNARRTDAECCCRDYCG